MCVWAEPPARLDHTGVAREILRGEISDFDMNQLPTISVQ
jgi:hypothetical protein